MTGSTPGYVQTLALLPASAAIARRSVRTTLACWGLEDLTADAELIASELVTNAVQHARPIGATPEDPGRCRLTLERPSPGVVWLTVSDPSRRRPGHRVATADDESGRGLAVVGATAHRFMMQRARDGKAAWVELKADR
ncbi:ATP-binding protein [Streptomyces sp. NPDC088560]|uniref:ATP-binding protein n=1 Tax=Streptomyces sp. NPDC088560 TaxID=3365868 RepID=UPI003827115A